MPNRRDTDRGRYYYDKNENPYWSVTTILQQGMPKPALIPWAAAEASKAAVAALVGPLVSTKSLLTDMKDEGWSDWDRHEKALAAYNDRDTMLGKLASGLKGETETGRKMMSTAHTKIRDEAAGAGTEFHNAVEIYLKSGKWPPLEDRAAQMQEQYMEFEDQYQPEVEAAELTVFNKTHQYAGTLDIIAKFPEESSGPVEGGLPAVVDIKTGKGIYPDTILQLAAYRNAEFAELSEDNLEHEMPELADVGAILHIRPDKWELKIVPVGQEQFKLFQFCQQVAWFTREGGQEWFQSFS